MVREDKERVKKPKRLSDPSNVSLAVGIHVSVVSYLVPDLILSCLLLSGLAFFYPSSLPS